MKLIKWVFYIIIFTVLLVVAAGFFIVNKVDPNDYKDKIAAQIESRTGRSLNIEGNLSWSFYPSLGFEVGSLSLENRAGFSSTSMLSAQGAQVNVAVMPLIEKKLEIGRVELQQPVLNLEINEQGLTNWGDLLSVAGETEVAQSNDGSSQASALLGGLIVKGINVVDGQVNWYDKTIDQVVNVSQFNLSTGEIVPGQAVNYSLDALVDGNVVGQNTQVESSGMLNVSEALDVAKLSNAKLSLVQDQIDVAVDLGVLDYQIESNQLQAQTLLFEGRYDVIPVKGEIGELNFDLNQSKLASKQQQFEVDLLGVKSNIAVPELILLLEDERLNVPAISITQGDAKIDLSAQASNLFSDLQASGSISTNLLKPHDLLPILSGLTLDDFGDSTLQTLQINSRYEASLDSISLSDLTVKVDESNITGSFSMKSFSAPAYRFQLDVDKLNADNYIAESNQQTAEETGPAGVVALPFAALKGLDVKGLLKIADFQYQGLHSTNLVIEADTSADSITVSPLKANLYGGESVNDITYDISGDTPKMNFKTSLANIKLLPFLQAMQLGERFEGLGNVQAEVSSFGLTASEFIANMNGVIRINLDDGAIAGANIQKSLIDVADVYKSFKGKDLVSSVELGDKTEFSNFTALVNVKNGVLISENIDLQAPAIRLKGRGNVDLNTEKLDLKMVVAIVKTLEGQGGQSFNELKGEELPLTITGGLAAPKVRIDTTALLKGQLKKELTKEISKKYGTLVDEETGEELSPKEALKSRLNEELAEEVTQEIGAMVDEETGEQLKAEDALKAKLKEEKAKLKKKLLKGLFGG